MAYFHRFEEAAKASIIKAYKLGEDLQDRVKKITKLEKKKPKSDEDESAIRTLREEAETIRKQQEEMKALAGGMGLGERILRAYFSFKLTELICHTLTSGGIGGFAVMSMVAPSLINCYGGEHAIAQRTSLDVNNQIVTGQMRSEMIQATLTSFQNMSQRAQELGITKEGQPLLSVDDAKRIADLAAIAKDDKNPQQLELYANKCAELGLDPEKAKAAFIADQTKDANLPELAKDDKEVSEHLEREEGLSKGVTRV